jgi:hypothetical protein
MPSALRRLAAVPLLTLVSWLARAASEPSASIQLSPPNPTAGQTVEVRDASSDAGDASPVFWTFGDGESAQAPVASHRWSEPGTYAIELTGPVSIGRIPVIVSPADTLRLNAAHPFEITAQADDPRSGRASAGRAFARSDRSGYFTFAELTGDASLENPDVDVKIVEAGWAGHYWVFWSSLTTLSFQLTVRDTASGQIRIYRKDGSAPDAGLDAGSFPFVPTPTPAGGASSQDGDLVGGRMPPHPAAPRDLGGRVVGRGSDSGPTAVPTVPTGPSPTRTKTPTKGPTKTPTITSPPTLTRTATMTPTPTITLTPTITPTPGPGFIVLQVVSWQWNFWFDPNGGPCALVTPYAPCQSVPRPNPPLTELTIHVGKPYQLYILNRDSSDVTEPHEFNGVPELGLPDTIVSQGQNAGPFFFTPSSTGNFTFACKNTSCGTSEQHEGMIGVFHVVP